MSLRQLARVWRVSPVDLPPVERAGLVDLSAPVISFDVFLSHAWRTRVNGNLQLRFGWPLFVVSWLVYHVGVGAALFGGLLATSRGLRGNPRRA